MKVQVNTDRNIEGSAELARQVEAIVVGSLGRFGEQLTRVEVHLSDVNSHKSRGDDKQCVMEARPAGMQPVVVKHTAGTFDRAADGAVEKLERLLDSTFGKLNSPRTATPPAPQDEISPPE